MDQEWRAVIAELADNLNDKAEQLEKERKDDKRREEDTPSGLAPSGLHICSQIKAGLINHQRQKHDPQARVLIACRFCEDCFQKQGLQNYVKKCGSRGN